MTVQNLTASRVGAAAWRITWTSDQPSPTYRVYRDGVLVTTTVAESITIAVGPAESPVIEVLDDPAAIPMTTHPRRLSLAWYHTDLAEHYRVEQYIDSAWVYRAKLTDDGRWYFRWTSAVLDDVTTHTFRIIAVAVDGNQSTAVSLAALMVRHPDVPDATFTYDPDDGTLLVAVSVN